jgi:hypothetical protein
MRPVSAGQILAGAALGMGNLLPAGAELPNQGAASVRTGAGSVRARASKYNLCSRTDDDVLSRGFQDGQHGHCAAEELEMAR